MGVLLPRSLAVALACTVIAQHESPRPEPDHEAPRLVRLLELPERQSASWRSLVALGATAALPLARAVADPRPDVAIRAAWVLGLLGPDGAAALPALRDGERSADPKLAHACAWAIARIGFQGRLLVDWQVGTVEFLDQDGKLERTIEGLRGPWHAEPVAGGRVLVSEYTGNCVREFDAAGKEVWTCGDLNNPYHAMRLPDGNTLISDAGNNRVVEVDGTGKVVWSCNKLQRPVAAVRTPDGHTLVAEQNGCVLELDALGSVVWRSEEIKGPMRAERLPDGDTLVASHGENCVALLAPDGKLRAPPRTVSQAQVALRRRDGHVLIAATSCWFELDAKGQEVWRRDGRYAVGVFW